MSTNYEPLSLPGLKRKGTRELAGPCPFCGGKDRFFVTAHPERAGGWLYTCRQCGPHGDAIAMWRAMHGGTYREACEALDVTPKDYGRSVRGTRQGRNAGKASQPSPRSKSAPQPATLSPARPGLPPPAWREAAANFLESCQQGFDADFDNLNRPSDPAWKTLVADRCLNLDLCLACGIGYHEHDEYAERAAWGLPPRQADGGLKLKLPRGIVIGIRRRGVGIVALLIRRPDEDLAGEEDSHSKYWEIAGGARGLSYAAGAGEQTDAVIVCESALDAALYRQESRGRVIAVATCGATKGLDPDALAFIRSAHLVIHAYDKDRAGRMSAVSMRRRETLPKAFPAAAVGPFKTPADAHRAICHGNDAGFELETWLTLAVNDAQAQARAS